VSKLPKNRSELMQSGATVVAQVSSLVRDVDRWTELSIWWRDDTERPFVGVVEGRVCDRIRDSAGEQDRFRAIAYGTAQKALDAFEPSRLRDELASRIPADLDDVFPDANTLRQRAADTRRATRGYQGQPNIEGIMCWLYPDCDGVSTSALSKRFQQDFGVEERTVRNALAGKPTNGWAKAFVAAMRYFDVKAWRAARG
jgi:hypothetical protein